MLFREERVEYSHQGVLDAERIISSTRCYIVPLGRKLSAPAAMIAKCSDNFRAVIDVPVHCFFRAHSHKHALVGSSQRGFSFSTTRTATCLQHRNVDRYLKFLKTAISAHEESAHAPLLPSPHQRASEFSCAPRVKPSDTSHAAFDAAATARNASSLGQRHFDEVFAPSFPSDRLRDDRDHDLYELDVSSLAQQGAHLPRAEEERRTSPSPSVTSTTSPASDNILVSNALDWFLQQVAAEAPELEFRLLPANSNVSLVVRRRSNTASLEGGGRWAGLILHTSSRALSADKLQWR